MHTACQADKRATPGVLQPQALAKSRLRWREGGPELPGLLLFEELGGQSSTPGMSPCQPASQALACSERYHCYHHTEPSPTPPHPPPPHHPPTSSMRSASACLRRASSSSPAACVVGVIGGKGRGHGVRGSRGVDREGGQWAPAAGRKLPPWLDELISATRPRPPSQTLPNTRPDPNPRSSPPHTSPHTHPHTTAGPDHQAPFPPLLAPSPPK